jgi:uncharacterized protein YaiE (UPF0345 family)
MNKHWDNSYFDGLILSDTTRATFKATRGVMQKGTLPKEITANAGREQITVLSGTLHYKSHNMPDWQIFDEGNTFIIPANTDFLWKVETDEMHYQCVYLDQPINE